MDAVFVSPHLDDAVLACGALIAHQVRTGRRVLIATVCAGLPVWARESDFSRSLRKQSRDNVEYVKTRLKEDQAAAHVLGCEVEWGSTLDAIYRDPAHYNGWEAVHGSIPGDDVIVQSAAVFLLGLQLRFPHATFYIPRAGHGTHIDHRAVRAAASSTCTPPYFLYADFNNTHTDGGRVIPAVQADCLAWADAVTCYRSQLAALHPGLSMAAIRAKYETAKGTHVWQAP